MCLKFLVLIEHFLKIVSEAGEKNSTGTSKYRIRYGHGRGKGHFKRHYRSDCGYT